VAPAVTRLGPLTAEIRGEGRPVVLLHGNGEDARVFDAVLPHLAGLRIIALESRAHGRTPEGARPLTIVHMAEDLDEALTDAEARGLIDGPAGIVGFSDGANIAMELAVRRAGRWGALVLIGGNYRPSGLRLGTHLAVVGEWVALQVAGVFSARMRRRARVWGLMVGQPRLTPADLARIDVPTLVIGGERDLVSRRHLERLARAIPGARLAIVPGGGHMLPTEAPDVLGEAVAEFVKGGAWRG
jgi:pimeloyl-ACP methyl ester carboxylesterase